ncbi:DUF1684 domain-containing protein [Paenibacillus puldeungensis]|uniref:DUF1684 domain-containing protein n=1 Tax=Paenibacillus puldeungensis TaxID=696536 RepID=A0ABW3RQH6_9BACL
MRDLQISDFTGWRQKRQQSVAGFQGDLTLVGLHRIEEPMHIKGIPGLWAPLAPETPGLTLTVAESDAITVDDQLVDGTVQLYVDRSVVRFSRTLTATATMQPGSPHLLAVWDDNADMLQAYQGISSFPYHPEWVIQAEFVAEAADRTMAFSHVDDTDGSLRYHKSPGDITFMKEGVSYRLTPFASDGSLLIIFGDRTNGDTTYGLGRMLLVHPEQDGSVTLDFNRSFLPPCAFSPYFNCPIPPANNRLPFEIDAGEKQTLFFKIK